MRDRGSLFVSFAESGRAKRSELHTLAQSMISCLPPFDRLISSSSWIPVIVSFTGCPLIDGTLWSQFQPILVELHPLHLMIWAREALIGLPFGLSRSISAI